MAEDGQNEQGILRELGDGLILRRARSEDGEAVAAFHANTLLDVGETPPLERLYYWILDLMTGKHPTFRPGDFTLVEETATGKIVSSMALLSQTWAYDGVPFPFGQPDVVSTDPAYRRRGLVRAQFDEIHRWSTERGELVQGITGIPWYYRQFDYEMALSLDAHRAGFPSLVPRLNDGDREPFVFRRATPSDLPFIAEMYQQAIARSVVASVRDEALWRFDIEGRSPKSGNGREFRVIEAADGPGEPVGLVIHSRKLWGAALGVRLYEVKAGVPLLAVTPSLLRYLETVGADYPARRGRVHDARLQPRRGAPGLRDHPGQAAEDRRPVRLVHPRRRPAGVRAPHRAGPGAAPRGVGPGWLHGRPQGQLLPERASSPL